VPIPDFTERALADLISLRGRVAIVTGAAQGTGLGIARRLAEAGAAVVIADKDREAAQESARMLAQNGLTVIGTHLDPREERTIGDVAVTVERELGNIDVLVNNAGSYPTKAVVDMGTDEWDAVLAENLRGAFMCSREMAKRMIRHGRRGVIVNIESTAAFRAPASGMAHYVSSKFGLRGLTAALAVELGPYRIRVLGVAPTFIVTPRTRSRRSDLDDRAYEEFISRIGATKPLGRVGVPDDVARVVLFCASDLSAYMTGSTLPVDAGDLAGST
jgi:NAD(P)-dependent dehydrogenase (short-subunit alcohol dehydrogenase family)